MFVVVFEVHPAPGKKDEYLGLAKHLKPILESVDGFIDNERFESKRHEGWVLSLSTWRDEKAAVRWRTHGEHHRIQEMGRSGIFSDYHLRVCEVTGDSHPPEGMQVIEQRLDTSVIGKAKSLGITEVSPAENTTFPADADWIKRHLAFDEHADGLVEYDLFESIYNPGKMLLLTSWKTPEQSDRWTPLPMPGARELRHRRSRNVRDYGMFERGEATQYFPDAKCPVQAKA